MSNIPIELMDSRDEFRPWPQRWIGELDATAFGRAAPCFRSGLRFLPA